MRHTILGAGGSIGNALAYKLIERNEEVRLVSRSGYQIPGSESVKADITKFADALRSIDYSDKVYLCVGLPYDSKLWSEQWPVIMKNVVDSCKLANSKLIFFDNVYMYGKVTGKMTETTPYNPCSKKGEIRARIAMQLEEEISKKNLDAIIARSADIYGPYASTTSIPYILAFRNLMGGKRAQWIVDANTLHSFTYTLDASEGMILLSENEECFNQIWHLPTSHPIDGETFIHIIERELGIDPGYIVLNKWMIKTAGLFDKTVSETYEMLYQSEYNYIFDSTKFNEFFDYTPESLHGGIRNTIEFLQSTLPDLKN
jgi:nucleoside-diphosphate-sugar epimerase